MSRDKGKTAGKSPTSKDDLVYHLPVLLKEVTESLSIRQEGVYVDCTFGGGGHDLSWLLGSAVGRAVDVFLLLHASGE